MIVNCLLPVLLMSGLHKSLTLNGVVLAQSEINFIADFSQEATRNKVVGSYNVRIVDKRLCVVMDEVK